jgi:hypothetical protein
MAKSFSSALKPVKIRPKAAESLPDAIADSSEKAAAKGQVNRF